MKQYRVNSVDEIFSSKSLDDAWGELYQAAEEPKFIIQPPTTACLVRLVGNFLPCKRIYVPQDVNLHKWMSSVDFEAVVNHDKKAYDKAIELISKDMNEKLLEYIKKSTNSYSFGIPKDSPLRDEDKPLIKAILLINNIYNKVPWQPCVVVNCVLLENNMTGQVNRGNNFMPEVFILPMNKGALESMSGAYAKLKKKHGVSNISGLFAHNLRISRTEAPMNNRNQYRTQNYSSAKFNVEIEPEPTHLSNSQIADLLKDGIFDLKKSIRWSNKKTSTKTKGFLYSFSEQYKNNAEMIAGLIDECDDIAEEEQVNSIESNIHKIPQEFFSSVKQGDSISSIEF